MSTNRVRIAVACLLGVAIFPWRADAFCEEAGIFCEANPEVCAQLGEPICHREVTEQGLPFLRPALLERTVRTNLHMDHQHTATLWSHADGCDFESMAHNLNGIYSSQVDSNFFVASGFDLPHSDTWGVRHRRREASACPLACPID